MGLRESRGTRTTADFIDTRPKSAQACEEILADRLSTSVVLPLVELANRKNTHRNEQSDKRLRRNIPVCQLASMRLSRPQVRSLPENNSALSLFPPPC